MKIRKFVLRFFVHFLVLQIVSMIVAKLHFLNLSFMQLFHLQKGFFLVLVVAAVIITSIVNKYDML